MKENIEAGQGDINCGAFSQADFILNYFLSNFLKFPLTFSISYQPGWQAGQIKVTLQVTNQQGHQDIFLCYARISVISKLQISKIRYDIYLCHARITVITRLQITDHIQQGHIQAYLIFVIFLHWQNFWKIKFTPKNANFSR